MSIFSKTKITAFNQNTPGQHPLMSQNYIGIAILTPKGIILEVNQKFSEITGYKPSTLKNTNINDLIKSVERSHYKKILHFDREFEVLIELTREDQPDIWLKCNNSAVNTSAKNPEYYVLAVYDYTREKHQLEKLEELSWLQKVRDPRQKEYQFQPYYGDITELNTERLILDSVGKEMLKSLSLDVMEMLDTSMAIYEKNGDYAFGMFVSGWCKIMDTASRKLCGDVDNFAALSCGKWFCHDSCWKIARLSIKTGKPVDVPCAGGINIYAVPIFAHDEIIGAVNIGYGSPSIDEDTLMRFADTYKLDFIHLQQAAGNYQTRPAFVIELAKRRLQNIARQIGIMVESKMVQKALFESEEKFRLLSDVTFEGILLHRNGKIYDVNDSFCRITGYSKTESIGKNIIEYIDSDESLAKIKENIVKEYADPYFVQVKRKDGSIAQVELEARNIIYQGETLRIVAVRDITEKKEKDRLLRESNEKFSQLVNQAPEMLYLHDDQGKIVEVNQSAVEKSEYSREELIGMTAAELDPDFEHRVDHDNFWEHINSNEPFTFQARHKTKSGRIIPVEISLGKIILNGKVHYMGLARDITERIEAQKTILANQERFHVIMNNIPDPVLIQDMDSGKIVDVNYEALHKYGYTLDEMLTMYPQDFDTPEQAKFVPQRLAAIQKSGKLFFQTVHRKKDGTEFPVEYHGHGFKFEGKNLYVSICRDITERMEASRSLRESEEMYRLLAENSADCIWQMTTRLKFTYLSPSLYMMTGANPEEWIGTHLWEHTTKLEFIKMARLALKMIKQYLSFKFVIFETRMFNKAGELKPLEITAQPLIRNGKLIGLQGSTRLIEERKKQEEELKKYRENLEQLVKERTRELEKKNADLIRYNKLFVGREFRIKELRDEVESLKKKIEDITGQPYREYD